MTFERYMMVVIIFRMKLMILKEKELNLIWIMDIRLHVPFDQTKMPGLSTGCCTAAKAPVNSPKMQPSLNFEVKMLHFALGSQKTLT